LHGVLSRRKGEASLLLPHPESLLCRPHGKNLGVEVIYGKLDGKKSWRL
jgi:hypothetical protein